ncbi:MAG: 16S rRNA (cytidine(1402)-2'-O)-methyltransferase [Deltaproteobacteria bacterium]|nr:16S rRNA (cytidine(1402)-2'-O)-methyltransferase [Deltaproteobacteria bacterium]
MQESERHAAREREDGTLSLVATPIGNLDDITLRALKVLAACDVVLAEDTRRTLQLLRAHKIEAHAIERLDDHVARHKCESLIRRMRDDNAWMAMVTDAGTPLVSDPGAFLVRAAIDAGVRVESVPGPSAAVSALLVSGLAGEGYRFVGFLPREGPDRQRAIAAIARDPLPSVLYESPHRTSQTLRDLAGACGPARQACVARELTKLHEEAMRDTLSQLAERTEPGVLGEVSIVVAGFLQVDSAGDSDDTPALDRALDAALGAGMKPSVAAREVAKALGLDRASVYAHALARSQK